MMSLETYVATERLIEHIQGHFTHSDLELVKRACAFAEDHYANIEHPSGEHYIQYAAEVAIRLDDLNADPIAVSAVMIYPPPPATAKALDDLGKEFNDRIELVNLIQEIVRLGNLEWNIWSVSSETNEAGERRATLLKMYLLALDEPKSDDQKTGFLTAVHFQKKEKQVENLIRMFLATVTDIRALIIKLVDRLHFITLLKYLPESRQESINCKLLTKITIAIYAPLADRLGFWRLKSELEDMSFRLLDIHRYKEIARQLAARKREREEYITRVIVPNLEKALEGYGIKVEIYGRAKHIYSIYRKMEAKQFTFEEINDLLGVRIIVDTIDDCYLVQEIIHELWSPVTEVYGGERGRDWIANPKENGYQSLHTTIEIDAKVVEVQIRTYEMHVIAEYGAAAVHWRYKESKAYRKGKIPRVTKIKDRVWSELLAELRRHLTSADNFDTSMQRRFFKYWTSVITPKGHVLGFPSGATPLDFAYRIHTSLGNKYVGAKVNGRIVRLDYTLKNGDIVELLTSHTRIGPSLEWLSKSRIDDELKKDDTFELLISRTREGPSPEWISKDKVGYSYYIFARTRRARSKIRHWLNKQNPKT